jgi:hypothetical protein
MDTPVVKVPVYVVNFKDVGRRERMTARFATLGITPIFVPGVETSDPRLEKVAEGDRKVWAIMLQHMDSIQHFFDDPSKPEYCVICEDDIFVAKTYNEDLQEVLIHFNQMELDVMMLGYLLPYTIDMSTCLHKQYFSIMRTTPKFIYHEYPNDIWGTQMYLIKRTYAEHLLKTYTFEHALANPTTVTYSSDWIITKIGKKSLIEPMMAVEEGVNNSGREDQVDYHIRCRDLNYNPDKYL